MATEGAGLLFSLLTVYYTDIMLEREKGLSFGRLSPIPTHHLTIRSAKTLFQILVLWHYSSLIFLIKGEMLTLENVICHRKSMFEILCQHYTVLHHKKACTHSGTSSPNACVRFY